MLLCCSPCWLEHTSSAQPCRVPRPRGCTSPTLHSCCSKKVGPSLQTGRPWWTPMRPGSTLWPKSSKLHTSPSPPSPPQATYRTPPPPTLPHSLDCTILPPPPPLSLATFHVATLCASLRLLVMAQATRGHRLTMGMPRRAAFCLLFCPVSEQAAL